MGGNGNARALPHAADSGPVPLGVFWDPGWQLGVSLLYQLSPPQPGFKDPQRISGMGRPLDPIWKIFRTFRDSRKLTPVLCLMLPSCSCGCIAITTNTTTTYKVNAPTTTTNPHSTTNGTVWEIRVAAAADLLQRHHSTMAPSHYQQRRPSPRDRSIPRDKPARQQIRPKYQPQNDTWSCVCGRHPPREAWRCFCGERWASPHASAESSAPLSCQQSCLSLCFLKTLDKRPCIIVRNIYNVYSLFR